MASNACIKLVAASTQFVSRATIGFGATFTICGWVFAETAISANGGFWDAYTGPAENDTYYNNASGKLALYDGSTSTDGLTFAKNTWIFVGMVKSSATQLDVYRSGGGSSEIASTKNQNAFGTLRMGADANNNYLQGRLAFMRAWTVALTTGELDTERTSTTAVKTASLFGDWNLQTDGSDASGNGRTLTLNGSPSFGTTAEGPTVPTSGAGGAFPAPQLADRWSRLVVSG